MTEVAPTSAARRLAPLTSGLVLFAVLLWVILPASGPAVPTPVSTWLVAMLLLAGFVVSELSQAHLEIRRHTFSVTMSELPLVFGLVLLTPRLLLALGMLAAVGVALVRRTAVHKVLFNLATFAVEIGLAAAVLNIVRHEADRGPLLWLAAFCATLTAALVSGLLVYGAIVRMEGGVPGSDVLAFLFPFLAGALLPTTVAVLGLVVARYDARALPLLLALAGLAILGFRGYNRLLRRYRTVGQMGELTTALSRASSVPELAEELVHHVSPLLSAERVLVRLDATEHRDVVHAALGVPPGITMPAVPALRRASDAAVVAPRGTRDQELAGWLQEEDLREAMVVPVRDGEGAVGGTLVVAQRLGEMATFGPAELELLQMVASHFSVAVRSRDLLDRLSFDAHHDRLTGLANRTLLAQRLDSALVVRGDEALAVLLLDLDGFKDVNDTLGHASGDTVLREVAARLRHALPSALCLARLGGDEFAVLVPVGPDRDDTLVVAALLQRALRRPLLLDDIELEVRASVGVVRVPDHGVDAELLLQRADVAMHVAKHARQPVQLYDPEIDRANPRRLALVSELRTAIAARQLVVHYQPQVAVDGRTVLGVEALVRWQHPTAGLIPPDDFIPMAEHTGLIVPLTTFVLRTALQDCARWRSAGHELAVAVNVSPRGLLAQGLVEEVAAVLSETGVPACSLTLEVTESSVMSDPAKAMVVLGQLHELGVQLSVDDFGTGYSSLAYLQRLPVDEVKIDKSFVLDLASDEGDAAIVRAIVDLGHTLQLRVVAEGVEDAGSMDILGSLGCDTAQGYQVSRPLPAEVFERWLAAPSSTPVTAALPRPRLITLG